MRVRKRRLRMKECFASNSLDFLLLFVSKQKEDKRFQEEESTIKKLISIMAPAHPQTFSAYQRDFQKIKQQEIILSVQSRGFPA